MVKVAAPTAVPTIQHRLSTHPRVPWTRDDGVEDTLPQLVD
jgi:hypothetical protein